MKLAVLILCHKNPDQINLLLNTMRHPAITFYIHVDKKSDISDRLLRREDVVLLPDEQRVDVKWATSSQVDAELSLLRFASQRDTYDYYWFCSGQDFPIKPVETIVDFFAREARGDFIDLFESRNNGLGRSCNYDKRNEIYFPSFILGNEPVRRIMKRTWTELTGGYNRTFRWARRRPLPGIKFYFGSNWACLSGATWAWMERYLREHPDYYEYFHHCNCPDESFFQTLLMNSPFASGRQDYLHYVDWSAGGSNPKILQSADLDALLRSDKLMARKFDANVDASILQELAKIVTERDKA